MKNNFIKSYTRNRVKLVRAISRVISRSLKLEGYRKMLGGCNYARSTNLHQKAFLKRKNWEGGVGSQLGGLPPLRGVKISLATSK